MNIKITSGKVLVCDPCYLSEGSRFGSMIAIPNGIYDVSVNKVKVAGLGGETYNKELVLLAKGKSDKTLKWGKSNFMAVDSGTAGFFDSSVRKMSESDLDEWYDDEIVDMVGLTSFFNGSGAASETAMGDGSYDIFTAKEGNVVVGVKIVFLSDIDIKYYNTPTMWSREGLAVYHTSNPSSPLYEVPKSYATSCAFIGMESKGVFGVLDFDVSEGMVGKKDIRTDIVQFKIPKEGKLAKVFKLSYDKDEVSLPSGHFILVDKKTLAEECGGDINKLLSKPSVKNTSIKYIKFSAPAGVYGMAIDRRKDSKASSFDLAKVVAIRISKTR